MNEKPIDDEMRLRANEAVRTVLRKAELLERPLEGAHDIERLQKTHAYIFQDTDAKNLHSVLGGYKPGEFRQPSTYNKIRTLETVPGEFYVAYSQRDEVAMKRLTTALAECQPKDLRGLPISEATNKLAKLYAELDYVHPFGDGNSRTLRAFTRELARDGGLDIKWERLADTAVGRDRLRIARDKAVLDKVIPELEVNPRAFRSALITKGRYEKQPDLVDVLKNAVRPFDRAADRKPDASDALAKVKEAMLAKGWPSHKADEAIAKFKNPTPQTKIDPPKMPER